MVRRPWLDNQAQLVTREDTIPGDPSREGAVVMNSPVAPPLSSLQG